MTNKNDLPEAEIIRLDSMMEFAQKMNGISGEFTPEKMLEAYANVDSFKNKIIEADNFATS